MIEHVKFNQHGVAECPICLSSTWFLERSGRMVCADCEKAHPNLAWYDDDADVIAQVCADELDSAEPTPPERPA